MQKTVPLVLEILKQEDTLRMSIFEQRDIASTIKHYSQKAILPREIDALCQEVVNVLNKRPTAADIAEAGLACDLKKSGQMLYDQLLTRVIKDKLKATTLKDLILGLDEELIHIPWEFLYDGEDFLSLRFSMGRIVRSKQQLSPEQYRSLSLRPKMLILANPTGDLKSAYLEGINIKNQFEKRRSEIGIDFKSTHIDKFYLKKNLRDYDMVHFAGHCEYDADESSNTGWLLSDGRFTASDILGMGESVSMPSLIFSNACHSGESSSRGEADFQERNYGLASAFLFSGVRHYIGTVRKVEDSTALVFAKEFYTRLLRGGSMGEAMRQGRLKLIQEYGFNSLSWVSYLLYGDPNFVLFKSTLQAKETKAKRNYKKFVLRLSLAAFITLFIAGIAFLLPSINPTSYNLLLKSRKLFLSGNNQQVIALCNKIVSKDPMFLAAYPLLADSYQRLGDSDKALKYYFDYSVYSERKRDKKNLASAYTNIGWVYQQRAEFTKAYDFYSKAISLSWEIRDKLNEAITLRKLAVWYMDKRDYDKALELLTKSSEINRTRLISREHRYNLACDYFDIALVFSNKEDYSAAREFYAKSSQIFEKLNLKNELSDYYFNLGEIYLFEKQYNKALDFYQRGLKIDLAQGNKPNIASDYNMIGELYAEMGNLVEAENLFNQALSAYQGIIAPLEVACVYENLGILYKQKGRKNKSREFLRQAQEIYIRFDPAAYEEVKQELLELSS